MPTANASAAPVPRVLPEFPPGFARKSTGTLDFMAVSAIMFSWWNMGGTAVSAAIPELRRCLAARVPMTVSGGYHAEKENDDCN